MALTQEQMNLMIERFGHDTLLSLATCDETGPSVRHVNALFMGDSFYVITWAKSGKMEQLAKNPACAVCGDWFTARGVGGNLGWVGKPENQPIMEKLRLAFAEWYGNGHVNEADRDTILLRIRMTSGVLMSHGTRHDLTF